MVGTTTAYTVTSNCMNGALAANGALFTGFNNSEITLGYYGSNGTGPQRLFDCGVNFPIGNNTNSSLAIYETTIFAKPNGGNVSFFTKRLDNSSIAPCVFTLDSEVNKTRLPLYNTNLAFRMTTLKNNATGSNNNIVMGFNKLYLSKDN
jgi:hypothetical protein